MKKLLLLLLLLAAPAWASVNDTNPARNDYTADGSTVDFPFTFAVMDGAGIQVYLGTVLQTFNSQYTVAFPVTTRPSVGTVHFISTPASPAHITILRLQPKQQTSVYQPNEAFPAKRVETDYDKNAMVDQEQQEELGRALKFYPYSLFKDAPVVDPVNGQCLQWAVSGSTARVVSASCGGGSGGGGSTPASPTTSIQFNLDGLVFGGDAGLTWDNTNKTVVTPWAFANPKFLAVENSTACFGSCTDYNAVMRIVLNDTTNAQKTGIYVEDFATATTRSVTSITRSGSTATVTTSGNHGFVTGYGVKIAGANQTEYNVNGAPITVTGLTTFTYAVTGTPATPATGAITVQQIRVNSGIASFGAAQADNGHDVSRITATEYGDGNAGTFNRFCNDFGDTGHRGGLVPNGTVPACTINRASGFALEVSSSGTNGTNIVSFTDSDSANAAILYAALVPPGSGSNPWAEGFRANVITNTNNLDKRVAFRARATGLEQTSGFPDTPEAFDRFLVPFDGSMLLRGVGQATTTLNTAGAAGGTLQLQDTNNTTNSGGAVVFGAGAVSKFFAGIKGVVGSGSNNTSGNLSFQARLVDTDANLTQAMLVSAALPQVTIFSADAAGANLKLVGDGVTTPVKYIRAQGGKLQLINDAYSVSLAQFDDNGTVTMPGNLLASFTSISIGAGTTNASIIGGTGGSIAAALTNTVSLNGGAITTSNTTSIGGTRLDVAYLASSSNCVKTNASGTLSTGACGSSGSGSSTQITVWSGSTSQTGFADFTWDDSTHNFLASVSPSGFTGTLTKSAIIGGTTNTINTASANGADRSVILGGAVNEIDQVSTSATDSAIIGSTSSTITDSEVSGIYSSTSSSITGTGGTSSAIAIAGSGSITVSATGANTTSFSGSLGSGSGSITNSTKSVLLGSTSASASGCDSCAVLGGTGGVASATNAVSINGGSATANNTTAIGGAVVTFSGNTTHGQSANVKVLTEELTILAAATTDTAFQFPAGSTSLGCTVRVTTVIPTATTFDTGVAGATTRYASSTSVAANTTAGSAVFAAYSSATSVRITPSTSPGAATGKVRVTCSYLDMTPATS